MARGAHGRAIAESGLTLLSGSHRIHVRLPCVEPVRCTGMFDVLFVTVKSASLPEVVPQLGRMLKPEGRIVWAMNGLPWWFFDGLADIESPALREALDPGGLMRHHLDLQQVIGCVLNSSSEVTAPGRIVNSTPGRNRLILGRPDGAPDPKLEAVAALLEAAGYQAPITPAIREALWHKMLLAVAVAAGPVAALTGADLGRVVADAPLLRLMSEVMGQARQIGARLGLQMADDAQERLLFYRGLSTRPSLLQDFQAGRPADMDNSLLAFSQIARALDVQVPALDLLVALTRVKKQAAAQHAGR